MRAHVASGLYSVKASLGRVYQSRELGGPAAWQPHSWGEEGARPAWIRS